MVIVLVNYPDNSYHDGFYRSKLSLCDCGFTVNKRFYKTNTNIVTCRLHGWIRLLTAQLQNVWKPIYRDVGLPAVASTGPSLCRENGIETKTRPTACADCFFRECSLLKIGAQNNFKSISILLVKYKIHWK